MNDKAFDDFLQQKLQSSSQYIEDGDFSARVVANLPLQKRLNPWLEKVIVWVPVTVIAALVLRQFSLRDAIQPIYAWVLTFDIGSLVTLALAMALLILVVPFSLAFKRTMLF